MNSASSKREERQLLVSGGVNASDANACAGGLVAFVDCYQYRGQCLCHNRVCQNPCMPCVQANGFGHLDDRFAGFCIVLFTERSQFTQGAADVAGVDECACCAGTLKVWDQTDGICAGASIPTPSFASTLGLRS